MSKLITPATIEQEQYDKISDDIYFLGKNVVLKFNVGLSKPGPNNERNHYHREFKYDSKYIDTSKVITIRRSFDYYFSIENLIRDDFNNKEFIRIGVTEIMSLQFYLKEVIRWFTDKEYEELFATNNNRLIMLGRVDSIKIPNLPMDKYLEFEPVVCEYENTTYPGVRMYLSSTNNFVEMSIDKLMGFYYLINTVNMYESAQLMLNYLQRPEYGTNMTTFGNANQSRFVEPNNTIEGKTGRMIQPRKPTLNDL